MQAAQIETSAFLDEITKRIQNLQVGSSCAYSVGREVRPGAPEVSVIGPHRAGQFECGAIDGQTYVRFKGAKCPYFCEELRNRRQLNFDLTRNLRTFIRKDHRKMELGERIAWLEWELRKRPGKPLKEVVGNADFFTGRGALQYIGATPVCRYPWKLVAFKFHGVIFITVVEPDTPSYDDVLSDYMGHKFEQYVTSSYPQGRPDTSRPLDSNEKFMVMSQTTLSVDGSKISFMYSAEMDCVGRDGHDIELKTEVENPKPTERLVAKYAKWWLQCRLVDVSEIIVGVKEKPHGGLPSVVKTLKSIDVERLPRMANGQRYWKPNDMLFYLHYFLSEVKSILDQHPEGAILSAELKSIYAGSVELRVEPSSTSKYGVLHEELNRRLSKLLC